jgi:hypothetical protein
VSSVKAENESVSPRSGHETVSARIPPTSYHDTYILSNAVPCRAVASRRASLFHPLRLLVSKPPELRPKAMRCQNLGLPLCRCTMCTRQTHTRPLPRNDPRHPFHDRLLHVQSLALLRRYVAAAFLSRTSRLETFCCSTTTKPARLCIQDPHPKPQEILKLLSQPSVSILRVLTFNFAVDHIRVLLLDAQASGRPVRYLPHTRSLSYRSEYPVARSWPQRITPRRAGTSVASIYQTV